MARATPSGTNSSTPRSPVYPLRATSTTTSRYDPSAQVMKSSPSTAEKRGATSSSDRGPCTAIVTRSGRCSTTAPAESSSDRIESTASVFAAFGTTRSRSWSTRYVIRSSTIPPSSVRTIPYWAPPTETSARLPVMKRCRTSSASGPATSILPRCVRSNIPAASRTARCSVSTPAYSIGMAQPANSPSFAPSASCSSWSGVCRRSASTGIPWGGSMTEPSHPAETKGPDPMADAFDVIVVGAGTGGYSCALRAAQLEKRVALVERDERLGGTCLLRGCIPTKALLQSAAVMDQVNRSDDWGITASGEPDWPGVQAFQRTIVDKLVGGLTSLIKARKIEVVRGTGKLVARNAVDVDGRRLEAPAVVIATGSYPKLLPGMEISNRIITSDQALTLDRLPASATVIGAGAVGLEFASLYRSFGAEVTLIEGLDRLAPLEDEDISKEVGRAFRKRGITAHAGASVKDVTESEDGVTITFEAGGGTQQVQPEICLVAVGRGPITNGVGLEDVGVEVDRGYVKVNGQMQTSVDGAWSIGDACTSPFQLAHVSIAEGVATAERIAGQEVPDLDYAGVPRVTFSTPEISSVGLTEAQARERGHDVEIERFNMQGLGKANIVGEGGSVKVVAEKDGPVLGVHMIGPHVTDLIAEAMLITNWEAMPAEVAALIHPHPTLSEASGESHRALAGKPLHTL